MHVFFLAPATEFRAGQAGWIGLKRTKKMVKKVDLYFEACKNSGEVLFARQTNLRLLDFFDLIFPCK